MEALLLVPIGIGGIMIVYMDWEKTKYPKGGKTDDIIYCYSSYMPFCFARRYIKIPFMPQNAKIISMEKLTLEIWHELTQRFKQDLKNYADLYKAQYPKLRGKHLNSYGVFLKIIHKIEKNFHFSEMVNTGFALFLSLFGHLSVTDFIRMGYLVKVKFGFKLNYQIIKHKNDFIPFLKLNNQMGTQLFKYYKKIEEIMDG